MQHAHYERYLASRYTLETTEEHHAEVMSGVLIPQHDKQPSIPIVKGIPRFVSSQNYSENFGLQWKKFQTTQFDSVSRTSFTADRLWKNTKWRPEELSGKTILEAGSGAGRFTQIFLQAGARVVSFDYSNAVEANFENNSQKGDLFIFQGDICAIPFPDDFFDYVFCYGVLQHTPRPTDAYISLFSKLRSGGKISIDIYRKRCFGELPNFTSSKYLWRPITTKMAPERLLKIVQWYIPWYLPINELIWKIPKIGAYLVAFIPIPCGYKPQYSFGDNKKLRVESAILNTFDMLGAAYDLPKTMEEVKEMISSPKNKDFAVFYGSNGIVANVVKK